MTPEQTARLARAARRVRQAGRSAVNHSAPTLLPVIRTALVIVTGVVLLGVSFSVAAAFSGGDLQAFNAIAAALFFAGGAAALVAWQWRSGARWRR